MTKKTIIEIKDMPLEVEIHILDYLNEKDLYNYSITSISSIRLVELIYKSRCNSKLNIDFRELTKLNNMLGEKTGKKFEGKSIHEEHQELNFWFMVYMNCWIKIVNSRLKVTLGELEQMRCIRNKKRATESIFEFITRHHVLFQTKRYKGFRSVIQEKLLSMKYCWFADYYYQILFPESYLTHFSYNLYEIFE